MGVLRFGLVVAIVGTACASAAEDGEERPRPAPTSSSEPRPPPPSSSGGDPPHEVEPPGPSACVAESAASYAVGDVCGLDGAGEVLCEADPVKSGLVYICKGTERRPAVDNCRTWTSYSIAGQPFTKTLCPLARCVRFADADARCPDGRAGFACPSASAPGVPAPPPPRPDCLGWGGWSLDIASGDLLCCS